MTTKGTGVSIRRFFSAIFLAVAIGCVCSVAASAAATPGWECIPKTAGKAVISGNGGHAQVWVDLHRGARADVPVNRCRRKPHGRVLDRQRADHQRDGGDREHQRDGNLVLGYDESPGSQTGSHDLDPGAQQTYTGFADLVGGEFQHGQLDNSNDAFWSGTVNGTRSRSAAIRTRPRASTPRLPAAEISPAPARSRYRARAATTPTTPTTSLRSPADGQHRLRDRGRSLGRERQHRVGHVRVVVRRRLQQHLKRQLDRGHRRLVELGDWPQRIGLRRFPEHRQRHQRYGRRRPGERCERTQRLDRGRRGQRCYCLCVSSQRWRGQLRHRFVGLDPRWMREHHG